MIRPVPKRANKFRVQFDNFGNGKHDHLTAQVERVTRPHLLRYDTFEVAGTSPIEIDLRDDIDDVARCEVLHQLQQQVKDGATFAVLIETLDQSHRVLEQWQLRQCRIVDCRFDELAYVANQELLIRLQVLPKQINAVTGDRVLELFG